MPMRVTRSATKRARSPSSPSQYERPAKRATGRSGQDTSVPLSLPAFQTSPASHGLPNPPAPRLRNASLDWVSQTQSMRLASPASEQGGLALAVDEHGDAGGAAGGGVDVRIDEVMADEPMPADENKMSVSPPRPSLFSVRAPSPTPSPPLRSPSEDAGPYSHHQHQHHHHLHLHHPTRTRAAPPAHNQSPNRLQIPAIQIQAATPSPVQLFAQSPLDDPRLTAASSPACELEDAAMCSPSTTASPALEFSAHNHHHQQHQQQQAPPGRRQRFTMGPRADCEMCRLRVKGHYAHFD
ncbi:hypothetical protein BC628DRAFT_1335988 [Trametes gibbosa]|nr:hypothetical protein BC628DRAFT_1335988 [Trametes gibbosa]